ncbi:hypothetical protein ACOME3_010479 [Neoechinorhynchus agilis]
MLTMVEMDDNPRLKELCNRLLFSCVNDKTLNYMKEDRLLTERALLITDKSSLQQGIRNTEDEPNFEHLFDLRCPLFYAVQSGSPEQIKLLLQINPNLSLNKCKPWGLGALCLAVFLNLNRQVEYLLSLEHVDVCTTDAASATDKYFSSPDCAAW